MSWIWIAICTNSKYLLALWLVGQLLSVCVFLWIIAKSHLAVSLWLLNFFVPSIELGGLFLLSPCLWYYHVNLLSCSVLHIVVFFFKTRFFSLICIFSFNPFFPCSRFVLNVPKEDQQSFERILFLVEYAHWFYEDNSVEKNPSLKSFNLKEFTSLCILFAAY